MKLVPAKCPSCGAKIEVDKDSDSTKCEFCRTKIIVDDAVKKYKIELSGEVEVKNLPKFDNLMKLGDRNYNDGEYEEAYKEYSKALEMNPDDSLAILKKGLSKTLCSPISNLDVKSSRNALKNSIESLEETDNKKVKLRIASFRDAIIHIQDVNIANYNNHLLDYRELSVYVDNLTLCLEGLEFGYGYCPDDKEFKTDYIKQILKTINTLLNTKIYFTGNYDNKGRMIKGKSELDKNFKKKLIDKKNNYINEINVLNPVAAEKVKEEEENIKRQSSEAGKNTWCYIAAGFFTFCMLMSLCDGIYGTISAILFSFAIIVFIRPFTNMILRKNSNLGWLIITLRIAIPILAFMMLAILAPNKYVDTWSDDNNTISLNSDKTFKYVSGNLIINGTYEVEEQSSYTYIIKTYDSNGNIYKYYKYMENVYGEVSFCEYNKVNNECTSYYESTTSNRKYSNEKA